MDKKLQKIAKQILPKIRNSFSIPNFDEDDIMQEIYVVLLELQQNNSFDNNHKSHASFTTYCYKAVYNHFLNLQHKALYITYNPCNSSCPFFVPSYSSCCSETIRDNCPYYLKYQLLLRSKMALATNFGEAFKSQTTEDVYEEELLQDIRHYCLRVRRMSVKDVNKLIEDIELLLGNNVIHRAKIGYLTDIIKGYMLYNE